MSGLQIDVGQGTLTYFQGGELSGIQATFGQGTLTPSGFDVTVNITGSESTSAQGVVAVGPPALTGQEITSASGTMIGNWSGALTGIAITSGIGTMISGQEADDLFIQSYQGTVGLTPSIALAGQEITSAQGTLTYSSGLLIGSSSTVGQGLLTNFVTKVDLLGLDMTLGQGTMTQVGGSPFVETAIFIQAGVGGKKHLRIRRSDYSNEKDYEFALRTAVEDSGISLKKVEQLPLPERRDNKTRPQPPKLSPILPEKAKADVNDTEIKISSAKFAELQQAADLGELELLKFLVSLIESEY